MRDIAEPGVNSGMECIASSLLAYEQIWWSNTDLLASLSGSEVERMTGNDKRVPDAIAPRLCTFAYSAMTD